MADRNPFIPSERRQDVASRANVVEDDANRRFAEEQAKLQKQTNEAAAKQAKEKEQKDAAEPDATPKQD